MPTRRKTHNHQDGRALRYTDAIASARAAKPLQVIRKLQSVSEPQRSPSVRRKASRGQDDTNARMNRRSHQESAPLFSLTGQFVADQEETAGKEEREGCELLDWYHSSSSS